MNQTETKQSKQRKEFKIIYEWLRIARKSYFTLAEDIRLLMDLIQIPLSQNQLDILIKILDPNGTKTHLQLQDFINCFIVSEDKKKQKEKDIQSAFRHVAEGKQEIEYIKLRQCLLEQGLDEFSSDLILKQLGDYDTEDGNFDYKKFAVWTLEK